MIEVTGPDGRVHSFANGTAQAQIDDALAAIYNPPTDQSAGGNWRSSKMVQILGGVLALAVIALLGTTALLLQRDKTAPITAPAAGTDVVSVVPTNQLLATPGVLTVPPVSAGAFAGFITTQQGGNVTVRVLARADGVQITKLPHGAPVSVTGSVVMPDGLWRQVDIGGVAGFVKGEYISQTQPAAIAVAPSPVPKMIPREFWGFATTKSSKSVNVRASPSASASINASVPVGTYVYVVGEQGAWYLIEWNGKRGWTNSSYISKEEPH